MQALSTTVGSTLLSSFQYQVDRLGQRTLVTETISTPSLTTRSLSYSYDGLLRLTGVQEQPGSVYTYTYDFVGNRLSAATAATSSSWSYDAADQVSTTGWSYDAAGNLLSDGSSSYSYDALNRLLSASQGTISQTYSYNGDGTLVAQTTGSTTTWYSQDLALPLSQILQSKGSVTTTYLYGTERLASVTGTTRAWYATDGLGSVRQLLSDAGTVTTAQRYDAWGMPLDSTTPTTFGFTGEYQDASLELVYLRARWYTTSTGRFLTRDPFEGSNEEPQTLTYYPYVHDNPVNAIDPSGKYFCELSGRDVPPVMYSDYYKFCQRQHAVLTTSEFVQLSTSNALGALVALFSNTPKPFSDLPGGIGPEANHYRLSFLSQAQERLDFVLWSTDAGNRTQFALAFTDTGFAPEFQDHMLWEGSYSSNQVGHFLTAVRLAYGVDWLMPYQAAIDCIIGHEKLADNLSDNGTLTSSAQCLASTPLDELRFFMAIQADEVGDYATRDCLIVAILPDLPEFHERSGPTIGGPYKDRLGNSHQDLRLSLKGWLFGRQVRYNQIRTLDQARNWLLLNLAPQQFAPPSALSHVD